MRTSATLILSIVAALSLVLAKPQHHGKAKKEGVKDLVEEILTLMNNRAPSDGKLTSTIENDGIHTSKKHRSSSKTDSVGKLHAVPKADSNKHKTEGHKSTCDQSFSGDTGTIQSPNYPNEYDNNMDCEYHITVSPGRIIHFRFEYFSLELSFWDCYDWLKVYDGSSTASNLIDHPYCSYFGPDDIFTTSNEALLQFHSDGSRRSGGFVIQYATSTGCGGDFTGPSGTISSPHYPADYDNDLHCVYTITVGAGKAIEIEFTSFVLENEFQEVNLTCTADSVGIIDGSIDNPFGHYKYCGATLPPPMLTTGNTATVEFTTDWILTEPGFSLDYTAVELKSCGEVMSGSSGTVKTPNYPNNYENLLNCEWNIHAPTGKMIEFTVNDFELEFQKTCSNDYLEIIDVNHNRIIGRYCGHINSGIPASSGNDVRLKLRTNRLGHFKGFSINYEAVSPPSPSTASCGFVAPDTSKDGDKMINGVPSLPEHRPWQIIMQVQDQFLCGGSIIDESWILTAAHCILHGTTASDYSIVAGSTTRNPHSATAQKRDVAVIIAHSNYENVSHSNDIALLKLSSPLTLNDAVRTICVCDSDSAVGTTCTASGFGDVDPGTDLVTSDSLLEAKLYIRDPSNCFDFYATLAGMTYKEAKQLCASGHGKDTCQGDSGGPFACKRGNRYCVEGVVSYGYGCAAPNVDGVYTRTSYYANWIAEKTNQAVTGINI